MYKMSTVSNRSIILIQALLFRYFRNNSNYIRYTWNFILYDIIL